MVSSAKTIVKNSRTSSIRLTSTRSNENDFFKCPEFQENITKIFNDFRLNRVFTDVSLRCDDGEVDVHGCILVASSGFFKELFQKQGFKSSIRLPNIKSSVMSLLVDYIYTGHLQPLLSVQHLRECLLAAKWLQINDFLTHVSAIVHKLIDSANYNDVWNIADDFDNDWIAEEVVTFVIANYCHLCMMPMFLKISFQRLQRVYTHHKFQTVPTYVVLKSIANWVHYDKASRSSYISKLLSHVQVDAEDVKINRDKSSSNHSRELLEMILRNAKPKLEKDIVTPTTRKKSEKAMSKSPMKIQSSADHSHELFRQISPYKGLPEKIPRGISVLMNPLVSPASICYSWSRSDKYSSPSPRVRLSVSSVLREWDTKLIRMPNVNSGRDRHVNLLSKVDSFSNDVMTMVYAAQKLRSRGSLSMPQPKTMNLTSSLFSPRSQTSDATSLMPSMLLSPSGKGRVPRLHLTATSNYSGISSSKQRVAELAVDVSAEAGTRAQRTFSDDDHQFSDVDSASSSNSTPQPVRYPSTKSDIVGMLARTSKVKAISIPETRGVSKGQKQDSAKNSLSFTAPIPVYHPMFYLNRSSAGSSAFKPFVKSSVHGSGANFSSMPKKDDFPNRIQALPKYPQTMSKGKQQQSVSGITAGSTANSSSTELSLLQHQTISTWTRRIQNFDGSPYSEPVVAILGKERHGQLLLMSFNLDSHSWRLCENVEDILEKHNFELFNNSGCVVHRNQVYLIGGEDRDCNQQNRVLIMDLREGCRLSLAAPLQVPRSCAGAAIFQDNIYVVGGISFNRRMLDRTDRYICEKGEWQSIAQFPESGWGMSLAVLGDRLVSIGGRRNGEWSLGCYSYDPDLNQWTQLLRMPREFDSTYSLVTLYGNKVLAFRKRNNPNEPGSVACLEPVHFTWFSPDVNGTPARRILTVARHRHKVWVIAHSSKLHVYDPQSHTWENVYPFYRSILNPLYAFIVYRAPPSQAKKLP